MSLTYEPVIGLEVHAQLLTRTKMFCGCSADYASTPPNTHMCPVCLGLPGALPVINEVAVHYTLMTALALHCSIPEHCKFDRKNYPYPDLLKGYQISQYDMPISQHGYLDIQVEGCAKRVGIVRVHLEEDTGKLLHRNDGYGSYSLLDANRAGLPLIEIVSEPHINSSEEARVYFTTLRGILRYLGVNNGDLEKGSLRCDVNVSLRPTGATMLGTKVEIKNINSFRAVVRAIEFEIERQSALLRTGGTIQQETRGWSDERGETLGQRSKEQAHDYRYFPEPDLPPLFISRALVAEVQAALPELADMRATRLVAEYALAEAVATQLAAERDTADFFEQALSHARSQDARSIANWIVGDLQSALSTSGGSIADLPITPASLGRLARLQADGTLSSKLAKQVLEEMLATGQEPDHIVQEQELVRMSDSGALAQAIHAALAAKPQAVADYRAGKGNALQALVGQVMKETRGTADPTLTRDMLIATLESAPDAATS